MTIVFSALKENKKLAHQVFALENIRSDSTIREIPM